MKRYMSIIFSLILVSIFQSFALTGILKDNTGKPLDSVAISFANIDTILYTNVNGYFVFDKATPIAFNKHNQPGFSLTLNQRKISFQLSKTSNVNISIFNLQGQRIVNFKDEMSSGSHLLKLPNLASGIYLIKAKIGNEQFIRKFSTESISKWFGKKNFQTTESRSLREIVDTAYISLKGYIKDTITLSSYNEDLDTIILNYKTTADSLNIIRNVTKDTLVASYKYLDADGALEGTSIYRWKVNNVIVECDTLLLPMSQVASNNVVIFEVKPVSVANEQADNAWFACTLNAEYPTVGSLGIVKYLTDSLVAIYAFNSLYNEAGSVIKWYLNDSLMTEGKKLMVRDLEKAGALEESSIRLEVTPVADSGTFLEGPTSIYETTVGEYFSLKKGKSYKAESVLEGTNTFRCITPAANGTFIAAGTGQIYKDDFSASTEMWAVKIDSSGYIIWNKCLGVGEIYDITAVDDGGYVLVGTTNGQYRVVKIDESGDTLWTRIITVDEDDTTGSAQGVMAFPGGGVIVTGHAGVTSPTTGAGSQKALTARLNENGEIVWQQQYGFLGSGSNEYGYDIVSANDSGFIITGDFIAGNGMAGSQRMAIRCDDDGTVIWKKTYGKDYEYEVAYAGLSITGGGYIMACTKYEIDTSTGGGSQDYELYLVDEEGMHKNSVVYGKHEGMAQINEYPQGMVETSDGGYMLAGYSSDGSGRFDGTAVKFNNNLEYDWSISLSDDIPSATDLAYDIIPAGDNKYIVVSTTNIYGWAYKLDEDGNHLWYSFQNKN